MHRHIRCRRSFIRRRARAIAALLPIIGTLAQSRPISASASLLLVQHPDSGWIFSRSVVPVARKEYSKYQPCSHVQYNVKMTFTPVPGCAGKDSLIMLLGKLATALDNFNL